MDRKTTISKAEELTPLATSDPQIPIPDNAEFQMAKAVAYPTLHEQVYSSILEAICSGLLSPGDRINQDELAASLNVSRQPVTQALTLLRSQDFVQDTGRRGLVVAQLSTSFLTSLYQLRESLDPMAAKLAARNHTKLSASEGRNLMEQGRLAIEDGKVTSLTRADMAFHMWIYESSGNPLLTEMLRNYWHHLRRAMLSVVGLRNKRTLVWDDHQAILEAILAGDEKNAEALALKHIQTAYRKVVGSFAD